MTCLGRSHPPYSYYFNGVQLPPDDMIHVCVWWRGCWCYRDGTVSSSTLIGSLPITHTHARVCTDFCPLYSHVYTTSLFRAQPDYSSVGSPCCSESQLKLIACVAKSLLFTCNLMFSASYLFCLLCCYLTLQP